MRKFILQDDVYMTEDLYAPKGSVVQFSPYVLDAHIAANELKGFTPVYIPTAKSLWTGDMEELAIQTHWIQSSQLKEVN